MKVVVLKMQINNCLPLSQEEKGRNENGATEEFSLLDSKEKTKVSNT